jgi:uncharacterized membrane protein YhaH (DUF805 family)
MNLSIARDGAEIGTWPKKEVEALYQAGTLYSSDYFWCEGMLDWQPLLALVKPNPPSATTMVSELVPESDLVLASEPEEQSPPETEVLAEPPRRYVLPAGIKLGDDNIGKTEGIDDCRQELSKNAAAKKPSFLLPNGRIGRMRFFALYLVYLLIFGSVVVIIEAITGIKLDSINVQNDPRLPLYSLFAPFAMLYAWASFALLAKRLHDLGQSGWWSVLFVVPFLGGLFWLALLVAPGDAFDNKYGPAPE